MKVCAIMATCGRHKVAERSLRFFLDQDYPGPHMLLIYNNSDTPQGLWKPSLGEIPINKQVDLVNVSISSRTNERYNTLGDIYNDALKFVPTDVDTIIHWDDDDIFLPNHISEGVRGLKDSQLIKKVAYKPERSYYRHPNGIELMGNNLEPSVFVEASFIREHGYSLTTSDQHMSWFSPLLREGKMIVDPKGLPTMIYNWGDTDIPTFKTSGNAGHPNNFKNYRDFSRDHGDQVLLPWPKNDVEKYYQLVNYDSRLNSQSAEPAG